MSHLYQRPCNFLSHLERLARQDWPSRSIQDLPPPRHLSEQKPTSPQAHRCVSFRQTPFLQIQAKIDREYMVGDENWRKTITITQRQTLTTRCLTATKSCPNRDGLEPNKRSMQNAEKTWRTIACDLGCWEPPTETLWDHNQPNQKKWSEEDRKLRRLLCATSRRKKPSRSNRPSWWTLLLKLEECKTSHFTTRRKWAHARKNTISLHVDKYDPTLTALHVSRNIWRQQRWCFCLGDPYPFCWFPPLKSTSTQTKSN